jgi:hypothetical protein
MKIIPNFAHLRKEIMNLIILHSEDVDVKHILRLMAFQSNLQDYLTQLENGDPLLIRLSPAVEGNELVDRLLNFKINNLRLRLPKK